MLIQTIIVLIVVGVLLWLVNNKIPMDGTIKSIINIVVIIAVIVWLLRIFGIVSFCSAPTPATCCRLAG